MNSQSAILDLAGRFDGYMVQYYATISDMRDAGLITTTYACEGFVIARAVPQPAMQRRAHHGWRGSRGAFVRQYMASRQLSNCQRPEAGK